MIIENIVVIDDIFLIIQYINKYIFEYESRKKINECPCIGRRLQKI
jgi:hypothetical protein